jgi:hypothetical protein
VTIIADIVERIEGWGPGTVFTASHFFDLAGRPAVAQSLHRLVNRGMLRRIGRGVFEFPRFSAAGTPLPPDLEVVARAVASAAGARVQLAGVHAAERLGLISNVPRGPVTFLTDGTSRRLRIADQEIELRHVSPRQLVAVGSVAGLVYQALRFLGEEGTDDTVIEALADRLSPAEKAYLASKAQHFPVWMLPIIHEVTGGLKPARGIPPLAPMRPGQTERLHDSRHGLVRRFFRRVTG